MTMTWPEAFREARRICAFDYVWKIGLVSLGLIVMATAITSMHAVLHTESRFDWFITGFIDAAAVYSVLMLVRVVADARERLKNEQRLREWADMFAATLAEILRNTHGINSEVIIDPVTRRIKVTTLPERTVH